MPTRAILLPVTRDARMSATILCLCLSNVANACVNHRPRVIHLDIGANNGEASRDFALQHAAERPQLFAFEPNPRFVKHLALLHKHLNLTHVRAAAWVADTILDFQFSSWDEGSSLVAAQSAFGDGHAWKSANGGCRKRARAMWKHRSWQMMCGILGALAAAPSSATNHAWTKCEQSILRGGCGRRCAPPRREATRSSPKWT